MAWSFFSLSFSCAVLACSAEQNHCLEECLKVKVFTLKTSVITNYLIISVWSDFILCECRLFRAALHTSADITEVHFVFLSQQPPTLLHHLIPSSSPFAPLTSKHFTPTKPPLTHKSWLSILSPDIQRSRPLRHSVPTTPAYSHAFSCRPRRTLDDCSDFLWCKSGR